MLGQGKLLDAFLGVTRLPSLEMGLGPQTFLVLLGLLALPFVLAPGKEVARGIGALRPGGSGARLLAAVPFAASNHLFANTRYLLPCFGIGFAAALAVAEIRGVRDTWLRNIALVLLVQDLLQLSAAMSHGVRMILGIADVAAVLLALSPGLRGFVRHRARALAVAGLAALVLPVPSWRASARPTGPERWAPSTRSTTSPAASTTRPGAGSTTSERMAPSR